MGVPIWVVAAKVLTSALGVRACGGGAPWISAACRVGPVGRGGEQRKRAIPRMPTHARNSKPACAEPPILSAVATTIGATVAPTVKPALTVATERREVSSELLDHMASCSEAESTMP